MFSTFLNTAFWKAEKITRYYKNCFKNFRENGFPESGGRKIAAAPIS